MLTSALAGCPKGKNENETHQKCPSQPLLIFAKSENSQLTTVSRWQERDPSVNVEFLEPPETEVAEKYQETELRDR